MACYLHRADEWVELFTLLGLEVPRLPATGYACPHCEDRRVRFMRDLPYLDGWWACEGCRETGTAIDYLAYTSGITVDEAVKLYSNQKYAKRAADNSSTWPSYREKFELAVNTGRPLADISTYLHRYKIPCAANEACTRRLSKYMGVMTKALLEDKGLIIHKNRRRGAWRWSSPSLGPIFGGSAIFIKCQDLPGRYNALFFLNRYMLDSHLITLPRINGMVPILANSCGFVFGEVLFQPSHYYNQFGDIKFVVPTNELLPLQIAQLRDSDYPLPVVSYHYSTQVGDSKRGVFGWSNRDVIYNNHGWSAWLDKEFVFWAKWLDQQLIDNMDRVNGHLYLGELPREIQKLSPIGKLLFIKEQAKPWREWIRLPNQGSTTVGAS